MLTATVCMQRAGNPSRRAYYTVVTVPMCTVALSACAEHQTERIPARPAAGAAKVSSADGTTPAGATPAQLTAPGAAGPVSSAAHLRRRLGGVHNPLLIQPPCEAQVRHNQVHAAGHGGRGGRAHSVSTTCWAPCGCRLGSRCTKKSERVSTAPRSLSSVSSTTTHARVCGHACPSCLPLACIATLAHPRGCSCWPRSVLHTTGATGWGRLDLEQGSGRAHLEGAGPLNRGPKSMRPLHRRA